MSLLSIALTLFLVTNPVGNSPAIVSLVKDFPFERQRMILIREGIISLLIALFFQFFGEIFLSVLRIQDYAVTICGGIILFLTAVEMIFSKSSESGTSEHLKQEPFIVPISTPLLSGPGLLTIIMFYAKEESSMLKISTAIFIAWIGVIGILAVAPYMQKLLGKKGLAALEQLMGMILGLMAIQMLVRGTLLFIHNLT